jgi:hypothetical protein
MTVDDIIEGMPFEHISVSRKNGNTDPADAEIIAKAILGEGYGFGRNMFYKNTIHFMKRVKS